ncbi:MAG: asparagine synthase (glutamine-hydrolyzing) [Gemmatimonadaceae bacterium]|nr:asparagine synthase (glutamine-hydrolyzing) [Gemmatimonadaceae bacterium]
MCGVAGVWQPLGDLEGAIRGMTHSLEHRGPDAEGHALFANLGLGLGHRRLSIVDLSPTGAQPMFSASGRFCMVFNGEVYNHRSLRQRLVQSGVEFRGTSDTEVMLAVIEADGIRHAIGQFAGMFALAVWDSFEEVLWLARDRMGEKPLYYGTFGNTFAFGSELKALRTLENCSSEIDPKAICDVLERGYVRGARSVFQGVLKVPPAALMRVTRKDGKIFCETGQYWSIQSNLDRAKSVGIARQDGASELDALLHTVVSEQLDADVPVGAFLSGGIDSSLVVAIMQRVSPVPVGTYTIAFDQTAFDESTYARRVAEHLGTRHTTIPLNGHEALNFIEQLPRVFDEPFADASQLPTLLVCRATRAHVTVALSGDGGDELFGGYSQYVTPDRLGQEIGRVPRVLQPAVAQISQFAPERAFALAMSGDSWGPNVRSRLHQITQSRAASRTVFETLLSEWADAAMVISSEEDAGHLEHRLDVPWPSSASATEDKMAYDMQTYLPDDILVKVDRSAMAFSLETRAPLLDHRIVEFALGRPLSEKIVDRRGKLLLRQVLGRYVPPELWDRPKQGFAVPVASWLRNELREWASDLLLADTNSAPLFKRSMVDRIWREHMSGFDHANRLWRLAIIAQWYRAL